MYTVFGEKFPRLRRKDKIKMDLQEAGWGHGLVLPCSGQGQVAGFYESAIECPGSIKCGELLEYLRN